MTPKELQTWFAKPGTAEKARIEKEQKEAKHEADTKLRIALDDGERRLRAYARSHPAKAYLPGNGPLPESLTAPIQAPSWFQSETPESALSTPQG